MKDLRIKEAMTRAEVKEFGEEFRLEYAYGAVTQDEEELKRPILLRVADFWMPLSRAKKIHKWLGKAIEHIEKRQEMK